jgi:hypothetical protein
MADHSIRVVTLLTGDEYLAMQSMADSDGLSDSAFMRLLLKQAYALPIDVMEMA